MAVGAQEHQIVDVGFTEVDGFPWNEMVGDAYRVVCIAEDASAVSGDESVDLRLGS